MYSAMHRHDISDHAWSLLAPLLPGRRGDWGGRAKDNRLFVNAIFWILRTGAPWRDLPPEYGGWKNTHRRFCRWRDKGTWEHVLANPMDMPDFEWLMIDSTYCKVHAHAAGAKDGNQDMSRTKGAQHLHLAVDAHGMPVRIIITAGSCSDIGQAFPLIQGIDARFVLADKAHSAHRFREQLKENDVQAVIPPIQRGNRSLIEYDKYLYKMRHIIGNTFLSLKQWRAVATRYAKRSSSFLAAVQVRCIALWCKIL